MALSQAFADNRTIDISIDDVDSTKFDNNSWRESSSPLLFTAQLDKKPAYYAVRSALRHRYLLAEQTGIRPAISTMTTKNGSIYNLAGQKVSADYKGIVIIDGKKKLNK